jgi:FkbM family methyltransferase
LINYEGQVTAANEKIDHDKNNVVELKVDGSAYKILLPNRSTDYIQQKICKEKLPYELQMLQDIRKKVSSTDLVLDIGANIGNHSLYLACVTKCHVVAFEPNRVLADSICASVDMNGLAHRVSVHAIGIGNQRAHGHFAKEIPNNLGSQSIELGEGAIQILSLDSMSFDQPVKVMKIDVEGMELAVLQGAKMLLRKDRPILYVECPSENEFLNIHSWLAPMDYCYWDSFNATPTHLFLPNEQVVLDQHFSRLHSKIALNSYRESQQLVTVKSQLNEANIKYRDATEQVATLKARLNKTNQKQSKLSRLLDDLRKQNNDLHKQNKRIQENIIALRASISFRIGYALVSAARSWRGFIKLPASLWGISKQILRNVGKQATSDVAGRFSSQKVGKYLATKNHAMEQKRQSDQSDAGPILNSQKVPPIVDLLQRDMASTLKVACIMDDFTFNAFQPECSLMQITPSNWKAELKVFQPELLFIESAWRGKDELWENKIGYKSEEMQGIVDWCRKYEVPTVFWNKEDPIHFQTFLNTAKLFDYVFTTDLDCIHRYKAALGMSVFTYCPLPANPLCITRSRNISARMSSALPVHITCATPSAPRIWKTF